jgi:hypothetical protein
MPSRLRGSVPAKVETDDGDLDGVDAALDQSVDHRADRPILFTRPVKTVKRGRVRSR